MHKKLLEGFSLKVFILFSLPLTFQYLLANMVGIIDNFMVGVLGPEYLAALRIGTNYVIFFIFIIWAVSSAGKILAVQYYGAGKKNSFKKILLTNFFIVFILSIALSVLLFIFSEKAVAIVIEDRDVSAFAVEYIRYIVFCFLPIGLNLALGLFFTNSGDTKAVFYQQFVSTGLNILLNYILIFGKLGFHAYGIKGAAISSVISTATGTIVLLLLGKFRNNLFSITDFFHPVFYKLREYIKLGFPILLDLVFFQITLMVYMVIIGHAGKNDLAIYGVISQIKTILRIFTDGFASASSLQTGVLLGAQKGILAMKSAKRAYKFISIFSAIPALIIIFFSGIISKIFKLDPSLTETVFYGFLILFLSQFFRILCVLFSQTIRAGKDTTFTFYATVFTFFIFGLPLAYVFEYHFAWGIVGIYSAISIDETVKGILFYRRFLSMKWIK